MLDATYLPSSDEVTDSPLSLAAVFLDSWPTPEADPILERIEALLADALERARAVWRGLEVIDRDYVRYVAERMPPEEPLESGLDKLHLTDLYLACACVAGSSGAIDSFEQHVSSAVLSVLARLKIDAALGDEIKQGLRQQWLMPNPKKPSAPLPLAEYRGRGELRKWFRVVAYRAALKVVRKERKRAAISDDDLGDLVAAGDDPELDYLKHVYRHEFRKAFADAFAALEVKQRNTLRYRHFENLSIDEIGVLYGVHRATVARWLVRARQQLLASVRANMMDRLAVGRQELDSIMRLIESRLEISIHQHLEGELSIRRSSRRSSRSI